MLRLDGLVLQGERRALAMMRSGVLYGPDELKVLDQIVDAVCAEMTDHPDCVGDRRAFRERISKLVLKRVGSDVLEVESIKRTVIAALKT